jgi:plastocyanin
MRIRLRSCSVALVTIFVLFSSTLAQKKSKYVCDEPKPEDLCNAANTCGSASEECKVDIRKSGDGASVKPSIPKAKGNQFFCVKAGTTVVWMTSSKNSGFTVYFGTDSPFTPDDPIRGGGAKSISVKAETPGCYKYDAGAFYSGAVYGMSGGSKPELVILP